MCGLFQRISQWTAKTWGGNFETVTRLGNDTRITAQSGCTKKVAVDITGFSEQFVFKMMVLQMADRIRHMLFTRQEGCFP